MEVGSQEVWGKRDQEQKDGVLLLSSVFVQSHLLQVLLLQLGHEGGGYITMLSRPVKLSELTLQPRREGRHPAQGRWKRHLFPPLRGIDSER